MTSSLLNPKNRAKNLLTSMYFPVEIEIINDASGSALNAFRNFDLETEFSNVWDFGLEFSVLLWLKVLLRSF